MGYRTGIPSIAGRHEERYVFRYLFRAITFGCSKAQLPFILKYRAGNLISIRASTQQFFMLEKTDAQQEPNLIQRRSEP
jgi:hypothetical protein